MMYKKVHCERSLPADRSRRPASKRSASAGGARRRAARAKRRRAAPAAIAGLDLLHSTTLASTLHNGSVSTLTITVPYVNNADTLIYHLMKNRFVESRITMCLFFV